MNAREKLHSGIPVHFDPASPEADRLIDAAWIVEAVEHKVRIDLEHAVIRGPLNLQYRCIEKEARVASCTILSPADFSRATFERVADFSGSVFVAAPNFESAVFHFDVVIEDVHFLSGDVRWSRAKVQQRFLAAGVTFGANASAAFEGWTCDDSAVFTGAVFGGPADFSAAHIGGSAVFSGAVFSAIATFAYAHIDGDFTLGVPRDNGILGGNFAGLANFRGIHVGQWTDCRGAQFHGEVCFIWARLEGATSFGLDAHGLNAAWFEGVADFQDAVLTGDADFEGVRFYDRAKFTSVNFGGTAVFKATEFRGAAEFDGVETGAELNFENALFRSPDAAADFEKTVVKGGAFFSNSQFRGGAILEGMKVEGAVAQFRGCRFRKKVSFAASSFDCVAEFHTALFFPHSQPCFDGTHFSRACSFDRAIFADTLQFRGARFDDEASFQGVTFARTADFSVTVFGGITRFESKPAVPNEHPAIRAARFRGEACFELARFERDARFDDTSFRAGASFRETSFHVVYLAADGKAGDRKQFQGALDLTGCTYERIRGDWRSLLQALHAYENRPGATYNRQPYSQLEKVYREVGLDRDADDIYLQRRHVEGNRLRLFGEPIPWVLDRLYWILANYGIRPRRLAVYALAAILFGTVAFHLPGSVQAKTDAKGQASADCPLSSRQSLAAPDSLRLALRYFLPIEISVLPSCDASANRYWKLRFQDWAVLIRVLGWILVPIGIASLTGTLRRVAP